MACRGRGAARARRPPCVAMLADDVGARTLRRATGHTSSGCSTTSPPMPTSPMSTSSTRERHADVDRRVRRVARATSTAAATRAGDADARRAPSIQRYTIHGRRYVELIIHAGAANGTDRRRRHRSARPIPGRCARTRRRSHARRSAIVRIGMTSGRSKRNFRSTLIGASLTVVSPAARGGDRRDVAAHPANRRADAPADARGASGRLRQARRARTGALAPTSSASSRTPSTT